MFRQLVCTLVLIVALPTMSKRRINAAATLPYTSWVGKKVLMISAHPDDIEWYAGGLVPLLVKQGTEVEYAIVTNGDKGCGNAMCLNWTSPQIAAAREVEAVQAAAVLGVPADHVVLFNYEDAMVTSYDEAQIREDLVREIRRYGADIVMSFYPYPSFSLLPSDDWDDTGYHPDHQAVGKLALDAQFGAGVGRLFPNAGIEYSVSEYYMWEFVEPTHYVDITNTVQQKIESYVAHATQVWSSAVIAEQIIHMGARVANVTRVPGLRYAEGYRAYF